MEDSPLDRLQERLGLVFLRQDLLRHALTHRSAVSDSPLASNERLEFLGDAVLGLVVCDYLFQRFPQYNEGQLAKGKSYIVSEGVLALAASAIGLEECLILAPSESATGGRQRPSILSDAFEALIAAIYLDLGLEPARGVILACLQEAMDAFAQNQHRRDFKSHLQEITQAHTRHIPTYVITQEQGRDHEKTFTAEVWLEQERLGQGEGKSKKEAEQSAAKDALEHLPPSLSPLPS